MIVVSGCPRSGTSLMMNAMRSVFGQERLLGYQFPYEQRLASQKIKRPRESDAEYAWRMYTLEKEEEQNNKRVDHTREMNPDGFWECDFTVQGVQYSTQRHHLLQRLLNEPNDKQTICKIVSQGLSKTDPRYVSKVIYMTREPRAVAKSQEALIRDLRFRDQTGRNVDLLNNQKINSPVMFVNVSAAAAKWFKLNPTIPVLIVDYEDLTVSPKDQFRRIQEFLGEGDFRDAHNLIRPSLKRSRSEGQIGGEWDEAEAIYNAMKEARFDEVIDIATAKNAPVAARTRRWYCHRAGIETIAAHCESCKTDSNFRDSLRRMAERNGIDWRKEPCGYECAFGGDTVPLTISESIKKNFWVESQPETADSTSLRPINDGTNAKPCKDCRRAKRR